MSLTSKDKKHYVVPLLGMLNLTPTQNAKLLITLIGQ